ncbi:hypothetical protein I4F81_001474 [Pyropia yezoensis]|uniref:Uncharacterized protein n=1 Tax=Pyropia yezoensis TaxID=2788 RepID=A0ACC3BLM6_PYRYE|nr:hypothetical protein I4F81_001474 [Neopyropia yezoensis]
MGGGRRGPCNSGGGHGLLPQAGVMAGMDMAAARGPRRWGHRQQAQLCTGGGGCPHAPGAPDVAAATGAIGASDGTAGGDLLPQRAPPVGVVWSTRQAQDCRPQAITAASAAARCASDCERPRALPLPHASPPITATPATHGTPAAPCWRTGCRLRFALTAAVHARCGRVFYTAALRSTEEQLVGGIEEPGIRGDELVDDPAALPAVN